MVNDVFRFCGEPVSAKQLKQITQCVLRYHSLSREEIASTLCEWFDWRAPNGRLKTRECRSLLQDLHQHSVLDLPPLRAGRPKGSRTTISRTTQGDAQTPLEIALNEVQPIQIRRVERALEHKLWSELIERYHYLGYQTPFGASLRYLIETSTPQQRILGCFQFSSGAWKMKARDAWIGWDDAMRKQNLPRIINNSRFLILPWVRIPNLASHALSLVLPVLTRDWQTLYGIRPLLIETLVNRQRFGGICYRAANWVDVGMTSGRGRQDQHHLRHGESKKQILLYQLCVDARLQLQKPIKEKPNLP